jgi:hypothetical protein
MQFSTSKTKTAIALILVSTIAASLAFPIANAHYPKWTFPTWTYVAVTNNPIGVNQEVPIVYWSDKYPPTAVGGFGDRWTFTVEVTKPDGSKETLGPFTSDPIGTGWVVYTPTQVGTYTIVAKMAEHTLTGLPYPPGTAGLYAGAAYVNDTYLASQSDPLELVVQEDAIQAWQETPLPTQFWTRPINAMNRDWACIAGNWLAGNAMTDGLTDNINLYSTGPESAHIMWSTPFWAGGIMNGQYGNIGYQTSHYSGLSFSPPIILNGKLYYNVGSHPREGWYCLDLYTGEVDYFHNTTGAASPTGNQQLSGPQFDTEGSITGESLSFGQIYNYESPNQHGGFPYLWSTTSRIIGYNIVPGVGTTPIYDNSWMMFDAYTGNYICSIANVSSSGTGVYGKDGSILRYNFAGSGANKRLTVWNTSQAIWYRVQYQTNQYWMWRPYLNYTFGGQYGFSLNVSIPNVQGTILEVREDQYVIGGTAGSNSESGIVQGNLWALSLKTGQEGILLWNITFTPPSAAGNKTVAMSTVDPEDGVFTFYSRQDRVWYVYSLETGQLLWESDPEIQMNYYGMSSSIYQGNLYSYGSGMTAGELICYDIKTGEIKWKYEPSQEGFESPYGNYPLSLACIADGKLYFYSTEHSPTQPFWRGSALRCINASNGAELWKISHHGSAVVADGYLVGLNMWDNQIYCYGKGPSATTVSAQADVITDGNSVLIKGTVTDQCAGAKAIAEEMGYVNGVPAMSDADQQGWMEYLYMQQAMPTNATGVEVTLDVLDPNGNFVHIDTVTSDLSGMYKKAFVPEVPGEYTVIATFAGSASYYSSYAETAIYVQEAPEPTEAPEYPQPIDTTWTIVGIGIILLIAIVIVGIWIKKK